MTKPTVAVIMGGSSFERNFSLKSGRHVCRALESRGFDVLPLDATENLVDTLRDEAPDVAFIAIHGKDGEDGAVPSLLEFLGIPYVGSSPAVCHTTWSKSALPFVMQRLDYGEPNCAQWPAQVTLPLSAFKDLGAARALDLVPKRLGTSFPLAVKPACGGSALGLTKVEGPGMLGEAIMAALAFDDSVLIQKWVEGVELSVTVLQVGERPRALPPVEIHPLQGIFDTNARQDSDAVEYYCPPRPTSLADSEVEAGEIIECCCEAAVEVFEAFLCRDLARVDMVWDGYAPQVLDLKVFPGLTDTSLVPMAFEGAGLAFENVIEELVLQAANREA